MSDLIVLGGSAAVVAFMIGVAALLGFRQVARIDEAELARLLAGLDPDARIAEVAIGADGRAAVARLSDGKILVARTMGDRVSLRAYPRAALKVTLTQNKLRAAFADVGFPALDMAFDSAPPRWLAALESGQGETT